MPEFTRLDNGAVSLKSKEEITGSEMIDQTTSLYESLSNFSDKDESVMSVSITQMPLVTEPSPTLIESSSETLTTNKPIPSEEHESTMLSTMTDTTTTLVSVKSEIMETTTNIPMKSEPSEIMETTTNIPMKTEILEEPIESLPVATVKPESTMISTMVDVPTTMIPIKSESSETMESTLTEMTTKIPMKTESIETMTEDKTTETSMPTTTVPAIIDHTTKINEVPNTLKPTIITTSAEIQKNDITTITTKLPHVIESSTISIETEHSTKFHSSTTSELIKEQSKEKINEKPKENSSNQIVISNFIWISILLIIFV